MSKKEKSRQLRLASTYYIYIQYICIEELTAEVEYFSGLGNTSTFPSASWAIV